MNDRLENFSLKNNTLPIVTRTIDPELYAGKAMVAGTTSSALIKK